MPNLRWSLGSLVLALVASVVALPACSAEVAQGDDAAGEEITQSEDAVVGQDELELGAGLPRADFSRGLPASAKTTSLTAWDTPAKGQGSRGWCTAFATIAAIENLVGRHLGVRIDLSEIDHYQSYRRYEMLTSVKTAAKVAIAPEASWPYDGNPVPGYRDTRIAKVASYVAPESLAEVLGELEAGHPLVIGITTFKNFGADGSGRVPMPSGKKRGGHAVAVTGFVRDPSYAGGGYLVFKNSWGTSFGDRGYGRLPLEYCNVSSCYFLAIRSVTYGGRTTPIAGGAPAPAPSPEPTPVPAPEPTPAPTPAPDGSGATIDDTTVRSVAIHDSRDPARFWLALDTSPAVLAEIAQVRYDVDPTFGSGRYATSSNRATSFKTTTVYRTYDRDWRTTGTELVLVDGRRIAIAGAVVRF